MLVLNEAGEVVQIDAGPPAEPLLFDPAAISGRQFAQHLAVLGVITETEALTWAARGDLPAPIEAAIGDLPEGDRFGARMLLSSATTYEFAHPLAAQLGALLGFDDAARRDIWISAAAL